MAEKMDVQMTRADGMRLLALVRDTDLAGPVIDGLAPGYHFEGPDATVFIPLTPGEMAHIIVLALRA